MFWGSSMHSPLFSRNGFKTFAPGNKTTCFFRGWAKWREWRRRTNSRSRYMMCGSKTSWTNGHQDARLSFTQSISRKSWQHHNVLISICRGFSDSAPWLCLKNNLTPVIVSNLQQLRPKWFVHENVIQYPGAYVEEPMEKAGYGCQHTTISPQRFGKPMNRWVGCSKFCLICFCGVFKPNWNMTRVRSYRIFWDKSKLAWRGPSLRQILKAVLPHQPLRMDANDMFFLTPDQLALQLSFRDFCSPCLTSRVFF